MPPGTSFASFRHFVVHGSLDLAPHCAHEFYASTHRPPRSQMALGMSAKAALGRLVPSQSALFVCDIQERFRPLICGYPKVVETASIAVRVC